MLLLQLERTPLHLSSERGHVDIVNLFISHGADIYVKDSVSKFCIIITLAL